MDGRNPFRTTQETLVETHGWLAFAEPIGSQHTLETTNCLLPWHLLLGQLRAHLRQPLPQSGGLTARFGPSQTARDSMRRFWLGLSISTSGLLYTSGLTRIILPQASVRYQVTTITYHWGGKRVVVSLLVDKNSWEPSGRIDINVRLV